MTMFEDFMRGQARQTSAQEVRMRQQAAAEAFGNINNGWRFDDLEENVFISKRTGNKTKKLTDAVWIKEIEGC